MSRSPVPAGVLLVATGARHRREAELTLPRLRPHLGGRPIWLVTDEPGDARLREFDRILVHPDVRRSYRDKIVPLLHLPFKRTLFLDSDVELIQPLDDLFALLDVLDVVGCHAPVRWCQWQDPSVPQGFCELNSGVLGLRRGGRTRALVRRWLSTYDEAGVPFDQASLRSAMWWATTQRRLRTWVLPSEYNLRTTKPWLVGPGMPVKIVHGRIPDSLREPLVQYLNTDTTSFRASSAFPTRQNAAVLPGPVGAPARLFILGAGRSGTSLVAGLFQNSGLYMGDSHYLARDANALGFFEDREVNAINEALLQPCVPSHFRDGQRWLATVVRGAPIVCRPDLERRIRNLYARGSSCFKDPRFCYTLSAWRDLLDFEERYHARYVCVFRHPSAVAASTRAELSTAPYLHGLELSDRELEANWLGLYSSLLAQRSGYGRWLFLSYESLFQQDGAVLDSLERFTGYAVDRSFVKPELRHQSGGPPVSMACQKLYSQLLALSNSIV